MNTTLKRLLLGAAVWLLLPVAAVAQPLPMNPCWGCEPDPLWPESEVCTELTELWQNGWEFCEHYWEEPPDGGGTVQRCYQYGWECYPDDPSLLAGALSPAGSVWAQASPRVSHVQVASLMTFVPAGLAPPAPDGYQRDCRGVIMMRVLSVDRREEVLNLRRRISL